MVLAQSLNINGFCQPLYLFIDTRKCVKIVCQKTDKNDVFMRTWLLFIFYLCEFEKYQMILDHLLQQVMQKIFCVLRLFLSCTWFCGELRKFLCVMIMSPSQFTVECVLFIELCCVDRYLCCLRCFVCVRFHLKVLYLLCSITVLSQTLGFNKF